MTHFINKIRIIKEDIRTLQLSKLKSDQQKKKEPIAKDLRIM